MQKLLAIVILGLFLITPSQADDIRDFQIEGISIGDSALNFFSKSLIEKNSEDVYSDKKFTVVQNNKLSFFETYDAVDYHFMTNDPNYIIYSIAGILFYDNNVDDCYVKMDEIVNELRIVFKNTPSSIKKTKKHGGDNTGKSTYTYVRWKLPSGYAVVTCYNYSKEMDSQNHLEVAFDTNELHKWLATNPY